MNVQSISINLEQSFSGNDAGLPVVLRVKLNGRDFQTPMGASNVAYVTVTPATAENPMRVVAASRPISPAEVQSNTGGASLMRQLYGILGVDEDVQRIQFTVDAFTLPYLWAIFDAPTQQVGA